MARPSRCYRFFEAARRKPGAAPLKLQNLTTGENMKKLMIGSFAALLATSGLALAHGDHHGRGLAEFDRDGNGVVTRDEMHATVTTKFNEVDANHDGKVTFEEAAAARQARAAEHSAKKDKNGDGQLSRDEMARMPQERFAKLDTNGDGKLSKEELQAGRGQFAGHGEKFFDMVDQNHDRAITLDEAIAAADRRFAKVDANNDGVADRRRSQSRTPRPRRWGARPARRPINFVLRAIPR